MARVASTMILLQKNNMEYQKLVKQHYKEEAEKNTISLTSTMADVNTRRLEIEHLASYLKSGKKCLEIGCGNGASSIKKKKKVKVDLLATDFSTDMIAMAKKQSIKGIKGKIKFQEQDVLTLNHKKEFDFIFTERCIINLLNWNDQKKALENMALALKANGKLIILEAFNDGLEELNKCREELGLDAVGPAYHNFYLDKEPVINHLKDQGLKFVEENNFLSSYFFGSRALYPAIAKANKKEIKYNSAFVNFFAMIPSMGNYSQLKILVFKKSAK